tara:strand:+ start:3491 stop:3877 length:387 start_codon:yes stop_codon:yes gene_type:complete
MESNFFNKKLFLKFSFVGLFNTLFGVSIGFIFLSYLPLHYAISVFLATFISVCFNYITSLNLVFKSSHNIKKIIYFFSTYLVLYILNVIFIYLISSTYSIHEKYSFIFISPVLILLSYLSQKILIFKK